MFQERPGRLIDLVAYLRGFPGLIASVHYRFTMFVHGSETFYSKSDVLCPPDGMI
jgi:hypothetical protein